MGFFALSDVVDKHDVAEVFIFIFDLAIDGGEVEV